MDKSREVFSQNVSGHDVAPRRSFLKALAASSGALLLGTGHSSARSLLAPPSSPATKLNLKLGFDNFSVRAFGWKAPQLIEYAASLDVDTILISDLHAYENLSDRYLAEVRAQASDVGIEIQVGTGCVCPTSQRFKGSFGTAEEHLALTIRIARALGSRVARCFLGSRRDRKSPGGIYKHIEAMAQVCTNVRSMAVDAGVKIAIENHSGDMQAWELVELIESAGKDFVGATIDSGNATYALEDPVGNLEILGPYAVSSGIRDSMVWESEEGATVQWTAMGDGCVDQRAYFEKYVELCRDTPVQLEIISGSPESFPYLKPNFWKGYERARANDFAAFLALAKKGRPIPEFQVAKGQDRREAERKFQRSELERSIRYCKETLGLGLK